MTLFVADQRGLFQKPIQGHRAEQKLGAVCCEQALGGWLAKFLEWDGRPGGHQMGRSLPSELGSTKGDTGHEYKLECGREEGEAGRRGKTYWNFYSSDYCKPVT